MKLVPVICAYCNKEFNKDSKAVSTARKYNRNMYCSRECMGRSLSNRVVPNCAECGVEVVKQIRDVNKNKSGLVFCNKSCKAKYQNKQVRGEDHASMVIGKTTR